jgi:hypothetical protein
MGSGARYSWFFWFFKVTTRDLDFGLWRRSSLTVIGLISAATDVQNTAFDDTTRVPVN